MKSKIWLILILGLVILVIASIGYFKAIPAPQEKENLPKIEITPKVYDFGNINYGDVVNYSFKVKNLGSEILEIRKVATSCACTTAKVLKTKLNPGEETDLEVSYDTAAMGSGSHSKGKQERIIYVKSNDPVNPQIEALIYANVK